MSHRKSPLAIGLLVAACTHEAPGTANAEPAQSPVTEMPAGFAGVMAPPADAEEAIRSEFAHIESRGTAEAYTLFAERHPGHPLAKEAARRAQAIRTSTPG